MTNPGPQPSTPRSNSKTPQTTGITHGSANTVANAAERLNELTNYTGAFGVDGTKTVTGYRVHEINPRICAGFSLLNELNGGKLPLALIDLVLREAPDDASDVKEPLAAMAGSMRNRRPTAKLWDPGHSHLEQLLRQKLAENEDPYPALELLGGTMHMLLCRYGLREER